MESRQQRRDNERLRIKEIDKQNKMFNDKFKMQELQMTAMKALYENEIIGLKKEVERLEQKNKELSNIYQKYQETEYNQLVNDNSSKLSLTSGKLFLFHGTNRKFKYLHINSFLTTKFEEAEHFAHLKDGGIVCMFYANKDQVEYDNNSLDGCEWYLSTQILQPIFYHSV